MIEVVDRQPLGNAHNNIVRLTVPSSVTTVAQLIALLNAGTYGDVFANNAVDENKGAGVLGTPINKALFNSIVEGVIDMSTPVGVQTIRTISASGWVTCAYTMPTIGKPIVLGACVTSGSYYVQTAAVGTTQCAFRVLNTSGTMISAAEVLLYVIDFGGE